MVRYFQAALFAALSLALAAPTQAYDTYAGALDARGSDLYAGAYVTLRFGGARNTRSDDQLKYGFRAGLQNSYRGGLFEQRYDVTGRNLHGRQTFRLNFLDTSFDQQGFQKLMLAGAPVVFRGEDGQIYVLRADGGEGEDKEGSGLKTAGKVVLWGAVIVGGILVVSALGSCVDGTSKDETFLDFCPLN